MKKTVAFLLTSCIIVSLLSPAGSGVLTEVKANTQAALSNLGVSEEKTEVAAEGAGSFEQSISELYDNSMSVTDEEIITSAEMMPSDFTEIESKMGEDADRLIEYLKYYEAAKSRYIAGLEKNTDFSGNVLSEWDRQGKYTSFVMPETDIVRTMVPRIKVDECIVEDGRTSLAIYEWMTVGYSPDEFSAINATAYGYNFSLKLDRGGDGNWQIASVEDTDQNFDWMEEEVEYSLQAEQEQTDDLRVVFEDGEREMMAAVAATSYSYDVNKAVAYADKYCINYNTAYNSYKGKGGDCANFVSQCLYNGGFKTDSVWYKHSVAWINVMKQIAHFKQYGTFMNANNGNLLKGNPIYFDWNGDGTYDHATICVGRNNNGVAILDSHTKDLYHATWTNWSFEKAATIQLRGSGSSSSTSSEGGSWKKNKTGYWYEYSDGTYLTSCFKTIDGKRYYFNERGYALKGLQKINGDYYFFNTSSCAMTYGWVSYNGNWYYFGSDGKGYTEWEQIGGEWYYFDASTCIMAKGFYTVKSKLHYFGENGVERFGWIKVDDKYYHLDEYGVVQFGWQTIGGTKYYFDTNGVMVSGNVSIDGVIYSFASSGAYKGKSSAVSAEIYVDTSRNITTSTAQAAYGKTGWEKKNGNWYYYKYNVMQKGWLSLNKTWYYLDTDGAMVIGWKQINSKWFYFNENGAMRIGWLTTSTHTYYFGPNGAMVKGWNKISGNWYYFGQGGAMMTGWQYINDKWYYLDKNGKMRTGWLKLGDKYYYLKSDGSMKTGWHDDADGETYYLSSSGVMVTGKQTINGRTYYFDEWGALID